MKIAVTGGIAEGKSTVLAYIQEYGLPTASADEIARAVFSDPYTQEQIGLLLDVAPPLTASDVRTRISASPMLRRALNNFMHPLILARLERTIAIAIEVPLLLETCLQGRFDRIWVVTCGEDDQLARLTARLGDADAAMGLIRAQLPTRAKLAFADFVVRTNGDEQSVKRSVTEELARLRG